MFIETRHIQTAIANGVSHIVELLTGGLETLSPWSNGGIGSMQLVQICEDDTRPVKNPEYRFINIKGGGSSMLR